MITGACTRAVELHAPGLVVEFELLPDLTLMPEWGAEVTAILRAAWTRPRPSTGSKWPCG